MPLVDPKMVSQTFEQQQQVRAYYSVPDVLDVDRYEIDGKDRAVVVLGVRELDQSGLAEGDRNWSNLHRVYTHGNGVIAAFGNQRPERRRAQQSSNVQWAEGQETDESSLTELTADGYESRVYFGEKSPTYSIVGKQAPTARTSSSTCPRASAATRTRPRRTTATGACRSATSSTSCSTP